MKTCRHQTGPRDSPPAGLDASLAEWWKVRRAVVKAHHHSSDPGGPAGEQPPVCTHKFSQVLVDMIKVCSFCWCRFLWATMDYGTKNSAVSKVCPKTIKYCSSKNKCCTRLFFKLQCCVKVFGSPRMKTVFKSVKCF